MGALAGFAGGTGLAVDDDIRCRSRYGSVSFNKSKRKDFSDRQRICGRGAGATEFRGLSGGRQVKMVYARLIPHYQHLRTHRIS